MSFPKDHRAKIHSINPLERLNGEIKDAPMWCDHQAARRGGSLINPAPREPHHTRSAQIFLPPNWRFQMRKHISFTIVAAIMGLAMVFWFQDGLAKTRADVARPTLYSASSISNPYLIY
jgi:hypothetical protein